MGFQTWHNYGYGICTSDIAEPSIEQLNALLDCAPEFKEKINGWFAENDIADPTFDNYMEYDETYMYGLATLMQEVIDEAEGVTFTACSNFDGDQYLIYQPSYPWNRTDADVGLTQEKIDEILTRYMSILSDESIEIDYQAVENGG